MQKRKKEIKQHHQESEEANQTMLVEDENNATEQELTERFIKRLELQKAILRKLIESDHDKPETLFSDKQD